mgnify:CR=1 FL=1|jgi:hypothetical protein
MPDEHNYPTEEELDQLKKYCGHFGVPNFNINVNKLLDFLHKIWWLPDLGVEHDGRKLELHTGGWSGNEEIISVLQNSMFWVMYWQKSERGGHYYFELPERA